MVCSSDLRQVSPCRSVDARIMAAIQTLSSASAQLQDASAI